MAKLLTLLIFISCSTIKKQPDLETVSISSGQQERSEISIDSQNDEVVATKDEVEEVESKSLKTSITIYSSLYASLASIYYFKQLEENNIELERIITNGFSVLVSSLYAKEKSVSSAEWKLFGLLKQLGPEKIYSKKWNSLIKAFASKEFGEMKLSELKIPISFPESGKRELSWVSDMKVTTAIEKNISLLNRKNYLLSPRIFDHKIRELEISNNQSIVFNSTKMNLNIQDEFTWGVITNYLSFISKSQNIQSINSKNLIVLDKLYPMVSYQEFFKQEISNNIEGLKEDLLNSLDINSTSSF